MTSEFESRILGWESHPVLLSAAERYIRILWAAVSHIRELTAALFRTQVTDVILPLFMSSLELFE